MYNSKIQITKTLRETLNIYSFSISAQFQGTFLWLKKHSQPSERFWFQWILYEKFHSWKLNSSNFSFGWGNYGRKLSLIIITRNSTLSGHHQSVRNSLLWDFSVSCRILKWWQRKGQSLNNKKSFKSGRVINTVLQVHVGFHSVERGSDNNFSVFQTF